MIKRSLWKLQWIVVWVFLLLGGCQTMKLSQTQPEPILQFAVPQEGIKIALILGGGGSKGLAHVGVLKELERAGIYPDLIVGCSSGAIVGALYADQPHAHRLEKLLIGLKRSDLIDISLLSSKFGIAKGTRFKKFLEKHINAPTFHELRIPLIAVATDLKTGELIELAEGEIIPSIMASSAVPGVFHPVYYKGRYLIDGGIIDPIPVQVAKKYGAQMIIAVDVGDDLPDKEPSHFFGVIKRSLEISHRKLSEYVTTDADITIWMNFQGFGMFSDSYNETIYQHGRKMFRENLPRIQKLMEEKSLVLHPLKE